MKTVFIRAIEAAVDEKAALLRKAINSPGSARMDRFDVDPSTFDAVPKSPFAYWTSDILRAAFAGLPSFESDERHARLGASSKNDFRYLRLWFESSGGSWHPFAKGGKHSKFYADIHLLIRWAQDAHEIEAELAKKYPYLDGKVDFVLHRELPYGCTGLTWPRRTTSGLSVRLMPRDCVFADKGPAAFIDDNDGEVLLALVALMNSRVFGALVAVQLAAADAAARSYEVGVIQRTPVPDLTPADRKALAGLALRSWSLKRTLDTRAETSHAFTLPALLQVECATLTDRAEAWFVHVSSVEAEVAELQAQIDAQCFALYGIDDAERARIEQGFAGSEDDAPPDDDDEDDEDEEVDVEPMAASLLSWTLGVAFGRFDVRLAIGDRPLPAEPEPFDPLPVCSPGMLTGDDGLPVAAPPGDYPIAFPEDGVLVDDPGHPQDLLGRVRAVFGVVFGDDASERLLEAEGHVGRRTEDLRAWFATRFFALHVKRYSKSRRKAPIYWQLATPSGSYSVWLYAHRFTPDTLFRVLNDFVVPKLSHEEAELARLVRDAGPEPSRGQREEIDAKEAFVGELRAFKAEVARVAPLWKPDLDDGVLIHFAPLWRLVAHERSWQKQCQKTWDKLVAGEYDWAHLAMHLWPERVVPKCQEDRSLAIAHGLEEALWWEDAGGTWKPRDVDDDTVDALIEDRSSTAVKAALADLLSAKAPAGTTSSRGRSRRRSSGSGRTRKARSATTSVDAALIGKVQQAIAAVADGASKNDVLEATNISSSEWNAAIKVLLERGEVEKTGRARGTRYHPAGGKDA